MPDDASWLNALPDVAPSGGQPPAAPPVQIMPSPDGGAPIPMMRIERPASVSTMDKKPDASWLDALPDVKQEEQPVGSEPTLRGIAKNVAAGLVNAGAGAINVLSDPFGNLVGKPLVTAGMFAHDALAPVLGYERFSPEFRQSMLEDTVPQPGDRLVSGISSLTNTANPQTTPPQNNAERFARKVTTGAAMMSAGGPLAAVSGGAGALVGDIAASSAPDWAQPAAELAGNVVGGAVPGLTVMGAKPIVKSAPIVMPSAREMSVGRTLDRVTGGSPIETSPVGPLDLAQATNNPEVAARVDLAPSYNAEANAKLRAAQQTAVTEQIGKIGEPSTIPDASAGFTNALRQGRQVAGAEENRLWTVPELAETKITPDPVKASVKGAIATIDPVLRSSMSPELRALVNRLDEAKPTSLRDLNGIRSDIERIARNPMTEGSQRSMARTISDAFLAGMDKVPEIAGAPAIEPVPVSADSTVRTTQAPNAPIAPVGKQSNRAPEISETADRIGARLTSAERKHAAVLRAAGEDPETAIHMAVWPSQEAALQHNAQVSSFTNPGMPGATQGVLPTPEAPRPAIEPNPAITQAYQTARDYTRQMRTMFGTPDSAALLARNAAGVPRVDASEGARRFFNFSNGSPEGPQSIAQLADFVGSLKRQMKSGPVADQMRESARSYVAASLMKAARAETGQNFNPKTMQDFLRKNGDWMRSSGLFEEPQIKAMDDLMDYASMLRRPEQLIRQVGSATEPRLARRETFIDQLMSPWVRHLGSLATTVTGAHSHGPLGSIVGMAAGGLFEKSVTGAESSMRSLMAQALLDPEVAKSLMMKATSANRRMMMPIAQQAMDTTRRSIAAAILAEQGTTRVPDVNSSGVPRQ